jgi:hypothetical protein
MVLFIAMMIGVHPIATDLFLPGMSALTRDLGATVAQAQLTLTALQSGEGLWLRTVVVEARRGVRLQSYAQLCQQQPRQL